MFECDEWERGYVNGIIQVLLVFERFNDKKESYLADVLHATHTRRLRWMDTLQASSVFVNLAAHVLGSISHRTSHLFIHTSFSTQSPPQNTRFLTIHLKTHVSNSPPQNTRL